ncbi:MAG: hypothetical protein Q9218_007131, partial [Villophora microphyllina]
MRRRLATLENENLRLRDECERARRKDASSGGGGGDEEMDDLEDEERGNLESKIRALESEVFDLKRGVWRERRRNMSISHGEGDALPPTSPGSKFDDVDLSGPASYFGNSNRRPSTTNRSGGGGGFTNVLSSGFSAFTGGGRDRKDSVALLSDDETDGGFDEEAFRAAQEEESRKRIERVREVKRGLKEWEGWRMDV